MSNTGKKIYTKLKEYYVDAEGNKIYTGNEKDNLPTDNDYVPPELDFLECPLDPDDSTRKKIWIGDESSAYCEDGTSRRTVWVGHEGSSYCEVVETVEGISSLEIVSFDKVDTSESHLGSISNIIVSGGMEPYLYSINEGVNWYVVGEFLNLPSDTYYIMVKDFKNNQTIKKVIIN